MWTRSYRAVGTKRVRCGAGRVKAGTGDGETKAAGPKISQYLCARESPYDEKKGGCVVHPPFFESSAQPVLACGAIIGEASSLVWMTPSCCNRSGTRWMRRAASARPSA